MLAVRHILLCIALLPMWALPPTHEIAAYQVKKCHCIKRGKHTLEVASRIHYDWHAIIWPI